MTVYFVFIDDSERERPSDLPRQDIGPLVAYGGVVVDQRALIAYSDGLAKIREMHDLSPDTEFKWNPTGTALHGRWKVVRRTRIAMLELAVSLGIRSIVVIWDRGRVPWSAGKAQAELLKYLYERITHCLAALEDIGVVVADQPGGDRADERQWLTDSLTLTNYGTQYVGADHVVLPILTARSDHLPHLQLADLVVSATTAAVAGSEHAAPLVPLLYRLAHKNPRGFAGGTGIKLFPDTLNNLHGWIFGEAVFNGPATKGRDWRLPHRDWDYATDDGLDTTRLAPATHAPAPY